MPAPTPGPVAATSVGVLDSPALAATPADAAPGLGLGLGLGLGWGPRLETLDRRVGDLLSQARARADRVASAAVIGAGVGVGVLATLAIVERARLRAQRRLASRPNESLPGPASALPFVGAMIDIVSDPTGFWVRQRAYAPDGLSWNSLLGSSMIFSTNLASSKLAFTQNDVFQLALHPNAQLILGPNNIAFMSGEAHRKLRVGLLQLFTRRALAMYVRTQHALVREHLEAWIRECAEPGATFVEAWDRVRDLNTRTSQRVFLGSHLGDARASAEFAGLYDTVTKGFLTLPIYFPGTALWRAVQARKRVVSMLEVAVVSSQRAMAAGEEPTCMLDYWMQTIASEVEAARAAGEAPPPHSHVHELACVMLDMLFASQDASTASLDWTFALMDSHRDVLARVVEEQDAVRGPHAPGASPRESPDITFDELEKMTFTKAVVKEILRFRPPAPMMPFAVRSDQAVSEDVVARKGTVFIADIWSPCFQKFTDAHAFDPDRMMPPRREDAAFRDNYLVFGTGPHLCLGRDYAVNHLSIFLAELAYACSFERKRTSQSDEHVYRPTVCPGDCLVRVGVRS